jgi:DNA-directed RNA polymerase specialized sigma24 family protein
MNRSMTRSPTIPPSAAASDASLLAAARQDPDAFRALYERYAEAVHGYFVRRTGSSAAALELTAETFAQAWFVRGRFRDEARGSAAPWIYGIARNVLLMSIRRGALERRATERLGLLERLDRAPAAEVPAEAWADGSHPRILAGVVITAVAAPGVAAATGVFNSAQQVAASVPAGTLALLDTEPSCTVVTQGVEYHCTLASLPSDNGGPEPGQWLGTVEPTVDQTKHVNGGCRSLNGAGTEWECYLGEAAVHQKIIGQGFLGQFAPTPGVG